jgi:hypothetical protein
MASIKTSLPDLSRIFGMTEPAIYERQRALVRVGALKPVAGRGPGSGVELNSRNLATLLIGCAAAYGPSDVDERMLRYMKAAPDPGPTCLLTGCRTLLNAIQAILEEGTPASTGLEFFGRRIEARTLKFDLQGPAGVIVIEPGPVEFLFRDRRETKNYPYIFFESYVQESILNGLHRLLKRKGSS